MKQLENAHAATFRAVRFVLTDMDETLTYQGKLAAATYQALEQLHRAGISVIPVTAAPAGWCDQMARMWPVAGVIGENGGLFYRRAREGIARHYWHDAQAKLTPQLAHIIDDVKRQVPMATLADDQPFRLTSIAFSRSADDEQNAAIINCMRSHGASVTVNNLWLLGWLGGYDKLVMARKVLREHYNLDIDSDPDSVLYTGDSLNDAPMFAFFRHSVGVSTVLECLDALPQAPAWITRGPGGAGFVEAANAVLASRAIKSTR